MNNLKQIRQQQGFSSSKLAVAAGVSRSTIMRIEAGKCQPREKTNRKLAKVLGVSMAVLEGWKTAD